MGLRKIIRLCCIAGVMLLAVSLLYMENARRWGVNQELGGDFLLRAYYWLLASWVMMAGVVFLELVFRRFYRYYDIYLKTAGVSGEFVEPEPDVSDAYTGSRKKFGFWIS